MEGAQGHHAFEEKAVVAGVPGAGGDVDDKVGWMDRDRTALTPQRDLYELENVA